MTDALNRGHRNLVLEAHQLRSVDPAALGVLWAGLRPSLQAALDPLVPHGLRLYSTVRAAASASGDWNEAA